MEFTGAKSRWLLPTMIVMGTVMIGMCLSDAHDLIATGQLFGHPAMAESSPPPADAHAEEPSRQPASSAATTLTPTTSQDGHATEASPTPSGEPPANEESSPAEMDILKQLSARREALDRRSQDIDKRETLLKIYEQRIEQKTSEMTALRQQIQSLLGQANETQAAQLDNLVKIYETMKPEDAAKIFDTLDMQILLGVIQRMKPKSTAPIMAKMSAEKAREVTISLLKQDKLPQIK
ncbi:MAG: hypothetical protein ABTQ34_02165 [Bdellovibrionales bacterium]